MIYDPLNSHILEWERYSWSLNVGMRTSILITVLLAFGEGNQMQSCWNGKVCLSDEQCGQNGSCRLPAMPSPGISSMINPGYVNVYISSLYYRIYLPLWNFVTIFEMHCTISIINGSRRTCISNYWHLGILL